MEKMHNDLRGKRVKMLSVETVPCIIDLKY